eukprot:3932401-Rhodomonas_salina.1
MKCRIIKASKTLMCCLDSTTVHMRALHSYPKTTPPPHLLASVANCRTHTGTSPSPYAKFHLQALKNPASS